MVFLGVDIGSTGSKCVAFREDGTQLAECYREYETAPGQTDLNPIALGDTLFDVIAGCAAALPDGESIKTIACSSFGESFVALDRNGTPLGDIIMYYADQGQNELNRLVDALGESNIASVVSAKPDTLYSLPKMMLTEKAAKSGVWKYLQMADYAAFLLSGEIVTDYALACRTMAFDVEHRDWWQPILDAAGISVTQLPTPAPTGAVIGTILPEVADKLGLPRNVKVVAGTHDQVAAAIGSGVQNPGEAVDGTGTVECITPLFRERITKKSFMDSHFVCIPYLDKGYVTYAFNLTGGALVRWYRDCLALHLKDTANPYDAMNQTCAAEPSSLLVVPHFQGAGGTPDVVKSATGTITGLTMNTTHGDIYRALLEGLSFEMKYNLEKLRESGIQIDRLRVTGGGAQSPIWLQIKSDIFGLPLCQITAAETGAMAGAMLGTVAEGVFDSIDQAADIFVKAGAVYEPNPAMATVYAEKYAQYKELRAFTLNRGVK